MASDATTRPMTTADLLAIPDDGRRRWLIDGVLWEQQADPEFPMTIRNRFHSQAMANVATHLNIWRFTLPKPWGAVVCGECGVVLPGAESDTTVGVDVAYVPPEVVVRQTGDTTLVEGVPALIVEILSPNDTQKELNAMRTAYRRAGVPLVWLVDPNERTVQVFPLGGRMWSVNDAEELTGGDVLPGFRVPVARLFE
jgi:Uma2 family endonuclease